MRGVFYLKVFKRIIIFSLISLFAFCLIFFRDDAVNGAVKGLYLCSDVLIPSLFPFMVCVLLFIGIIESLNLKNSKNKILLIFILSALGGYPIGAMILNEEARLDNIEVKSAEKMLRFCVNAGPGFIIIAVGSGIYGSVKTGLILFLSAILSSFSLFLFTCFLGKDKINFKSTYKDSSFEFSDIFVNSTARASASMINICSFVVLFCVINSVLEKFAEKVKILNFFIYLNEVSCSVFKFKNIYAVSFILGFGGICVIMQIIAVSGDIKFNVLKFLILRILNGLLLLFYSSILIKLFGCKISTAFLNNTIIIKTNSLKTVLVLSAVVILFLISVQSKKIIGKEKNLCYNNLTALAKSKILTPERTLKHNK